MALPPITLSRLFKILIIFLVITVVGLVFSKPVFRPFENTDTIINKIGCRLFEFNVISVTAFDNIDLDNIQIKIRDKIVFKDRKQRHKIGQEHGYSILDIYFKDRLIAVIGHMKTNDWFTNKYIIEVSKQDNNYIVKHEITGPDSKNDNFQKRYVYNMCMMMLIYY